MSNKAPPSAKREGTMQKTAREAQEYGYGCDCGDEEHNHNAPEGANGEDNVPSTQRQSTMQITAQEGIEFLKSQRKDTLLEVQGLVAPRHDDEEGGDDNELDNESDEPENDEDDDDEEDDETGEPKEKNGKKPSVKKSRTMAATAAEGEILLDYMGGAPDPEARTRGQQRELEEADDDDLPDEPEAKKPRRTATMQATTEEAKGIVDEGAIGGTRSETAAVKKAEQEQQQVSPKRASTMQKTAQEGVDFVLGNK